MTSIEQKNKRLWLKAIVLGSVLNMLLFYVIPLLASSHTQDKLNNVSQNFSRIQHDSDRTKK